MKNKKENHDTETKINKIKKNKKCYSTIIKLKRR